MVFRDLPAVLRPSAGVFAIIAGIFSAAVSHANIPTADAVIDVTQIGSETRRAFATDSVALVPAAPVLIRVAASNTKQAKAVNPSVGDSISDNAQAAKDDLQSSVSGAVNDSVNAVSNSASEAITSGVAGLQDKLFRKKSAKPAAATAAKPTASATNLTSVSSPTPTPTPTATAAGKPFIMDEGDGKHSILVTPGQSDVLELTPMAGSKTVFIDDATGDKYIVMPNGDISRVVKKNTAK